MRERVGWASVICTPAAQRRGTVQDQGVVALSAANVAQANPLGASVEGVETLWQEAGRLDSSREVNGRLAGQDEGRNAVGIGAPHERPRLGLDGQRGTDDRASCTIDRA